MDKRIKEKDSFIKQMAEDKALANEERASAAKQKVKEQNRAHRQNAEKILRNEAEREKQISLVKQQYQEELDKRKEIMHLRKLD